MVTLNLCFVTPLNTVFHGISLSQSFIKFVNLTKQISHASDETNDQEMFDAILSGTPIEEAIEITAKKTTENEIEFY